MVLPKGMQAKPREVKFYYYNDMQNFQRQFCVTVAYADMFQLQLFLQILWLVGFTSNNPVLSSGTLAYIKVTRVTPWRVICCLCFCKEVPLGPHFFLQMKGCLLKNVTYTFDISQSRAREPLSKLLFKIKHGL